MLTDDPTSSLTTTTNQKIIPIENLCCPNGYYMGPSGDCKIVIDNPSFGITSTNNSTRPSSTIEAKSNKF
ncbi:MAG TPA: hypothetical protein VN703_02710 [Candidatus Sulfopaludibacter sp.]|nr:hypothetical protein [Candidatus Sulfopaludibacter sp.]